MSPFGNGRRYNDVRLNKDGVLLTTRGLDRFIKFDPETGLVEREAGVLLDDIVNLTLPQGRAVATRPTLPIGEPRSAP